MMYLGSPAVDGFNPLLVDCTRTTSAPSPYGPRMCPSLQPIDFLAPATGGEPPGDVVIRRYRGALRAAALDADTRALFDAPHTSTVEVRPTIQQRSALPSGPAPGPTPATDCDANGLSAFPLPLRERVARLCETGEG